MKSSSIAKARGSITKIFHVPLENLRSDPRRTVPFVPVPFVPGTFAKPRVEMLANLVPAPGARHLCDPRIEMLANPVPAPGARHLCDLESES